MLIISGFSLELAAFTTVGLRMAKGMIGSHNRADLVVSWQPGSRKIGRGWGRGTQLYFLVPFLFSLGHTTCNKAMTIFRSAVNVSSH